MYDAAYNQQVDVLGARIVPLVPDLEARRDSHWYAVTVYPRHEKQVSRQLERRGVRCFVPMYRSLRRWKDRRKELDLVLFPGYAFVELELCSRLAVLTVSGVVRFVTFQGQPAAVSDQEIQALKSSLDSGVSVLPHPYLQKGRRVRLVRGPLAGLEGILARRKDRFRLVLSVDLIMKSVALEVDESDVEPC
jgi:transcription termination/antitermination protein NusG